MNIVMNLLLKLKNRWIGDKTFYKAMLIVVIPLIIQQLFTNFVNMLDNIMVGQTGTLPMSGVSVANQLIFVFNLAIFGSISAISIFGSQFAGKKDILGQRNCFRIKLVVEVGFAIVFGLIFLLFGNQLIGLYLNSETNSASNIAETLSYAHSYLLIMIVGFIPYGLSQSIATSIQETGETRTPMIASVSAVFTNFVGNSLLIFGLFFFPKMGVSGAAIATVLSRFVELTILVTYVVTHQARYPFFQHIFQDFSVPFTLIKDVTIKGIPLVINEILWSLGLAALMQCYSVRGIEALAAYNIANTIENLFFCTNYAMGNCVSIMVGQKLGADKIEEAVDTDHKLLFFAFAESVCLGCVLYFTSSFFPQFYDVEPSIQALASELLKVCALCMPIAAMYNACYFTMRCGGKTIITFLFDSAGTVCISFPIAYCLAHFTNLPMLTMFLILHLVDMYKAILGIILVNKKIWVNNLVDVHA